GRRASLIDVPPGVVWWRRLRSDRILLLAAMVVLVLIAVAVLAPVLVHLFGIPGPGTRNAAALTTLGAPTGPSSAHPFGVDGMGRDVLARVLYGLRSSLEVGG